jgi:ParB family chromosome partitioning protein
MMAKAERLRVMYGSNIAESMQDSTPADRAAIRIDPSYDDRLAGTGRLKGAMMIPVAKITSDPGQPRKTFDAEAIIRLSQSIQSRGVLQPIRVRYDDARKVWLIVSGERRWRACQVLGIDQIPAIEVSDRGRDQTLADQLVENLLREDLTPIDQANGIRELMELQGWDQSRVGDELGISKGHISKLLTLLRAPEPVRQKVASGELSMQAGYDLARVDATVASEIASVPQDTRSARAAVERSGLVSRARTTRREIPVEGGRVLVVADEPDAPDSVVERLLRRALTKWKQRVQ